MKTFYPRFFYSILLSLLSLAGTSQNDSVVFTNGNYVVGEIKSLKQGIMQIETDYSDDDFTVDWEMIRYVKSEQIYLIVTSEGERYNGAIESSASEEGRVIVHDMDKGDVTVPLVDIVSFKTVDQDFISRLSLLMSIGYTLTKANNSRQFSARVDVGYLSNTFAFDAFFGMVQSFQEEQQDSIIIKIGTKRTEGGASLKFFFYRDWFATVSTNLLQSSEQQLDLRAVTRAGIGNYIVNNQQMYFVISGGAAWNYEAYDIYETDSVTQISTKVEPRSSAEAFLGLEYNIFDIGDLDLKTSLYGYPSLTESGRFRTDFSFDIRYEFAFDLFFGIGFTLNYDSKPPEGASPSDYVLQTTLGWEL
ncbi:MAG: DUF481 domain-containing protein [bacterium]